MLSTICALLLALPLMFQGDAPHPDVAIIIWSPTEAIITPRLSRSAAESTANLELGDEVPSGHVVTLNNKGPLVLFHREKSQFVEINHPGDYWIDEHEIVALDGAPPQTTTLKTFTLGSYPAIANSSDTESRSNTSQLYIVSPRNTVIASQQPLFEWHWVGDNARFDLTLWHRDRYGKTKELEHWTGIAGRSHVPWRKLRAGHDYRLRISLTQQNESNEVVSDEIWFRILEPDASPALRKSQHALSTLNQRSPLARRVLEALLLESYGLAEDAETIWQNLANQLPDSRDLRRQLRRVQHRREPAPTIMRYRLPFLGVITLPWNPTP